MSKLGVVLTNLVNRAEGHRPPCSASTELKSGLKVTAHPTSTGLAVLSLTRTETTPPSQKEAEVCADHLGWTERQIANGHTRLGWPCLLIWRTRPADAPQEPAKEAAPVQTDEVCATCHHGQPDADLITCTLGWEAHERPVSSHPGVPLPLLSPQSGCMARGGRWLHQLGGKS